MTAQMKWKRFRISSELFLQLFMSGDHRGFRIVEQAIPDDAQLVNVLHAFPNDIELLIYSEEFPALKAGEQIPELVPVCVQVQPIDGPRLIIPGVQ